MSDIENKKLPAANFAPDGFSGYDDRVEGEDRPQGGGIIKGMLIKFSNTAAWIDTNDNELPAGLELVVIDVIRVVQKWIDQQPVETRILAPGEKFPDIEALNEAAPKDEWHEGPDGKMHGPWQAQHILYLLNLETMDRYSYPTGTVGGSIAIRELVDKTNWMRRLRGPAVFPRVALRDVFMNTRFGGRQRPHFEIKGWVQLGGDEKIAALPTPKPTPLPPMPGVKEIAEPTLSEHMGGDKVPFNDPLPEMVGGSPMPAPKPTAPPTPKPAAPSINKKGVQKLAGNRDASKPLDPAKLERLFAYCMQDVRAERELSARLPPLTPEEQKVWAIDQVINARGFAIDLTLAHAARKIAAEGKARHQRAHHNADQRRNHHRQPERAHPKICARTRSCGEEPRQAQRRADTRARPRRGNPANPGIAPRR
jgi:hypothetical protein